MLFRFHCWIMAALCCFCAYSYHYLHSSCKAQKCLGFPRWFLASQSHWLRWIQNYARLELATAVQQRIEASYLLQFTQYWVCFGYAVESTWRNYFRQQWRLKTVFSSDEQVCLLEKYCFRLYIEFCTVQLSVLWNHQVRRLKNSIMLMEWVAVSAYHCQPALNWLVTAIQSVGEKLSVAHGQIDDLSHLFCESNGSETSPKFCPLGQVLHDFILLIPNAASPVEIKAPGGRTKDMWQQLQAIPCEISWT